MKLFGKKAEKQGGEGQNPGNLATSPPVSDTTGQAKKQRKPLKLVLLVVAGVVAVGGVAGFFLYNSSNQDSDLDKANKYVRENNTPEALKHAKKALELDPNNVDAILTVANLTLKDNPEESKQYFARAFEIYKKENNPDLDGKTAINYWGAAGLAEQAGYIDQAKKYYQKVIDAADPNDVYHQNLVGESIAALKRLK